MQHLDEGTIHAWLDDALPPQEAAAIETHVARCAECAALVAEARGLMAGASRIVSSLDHVPAGVVPQAPANPRSLWHTLRFTPARASIAALVLVGVASMFAVRREQIHTAAIDSSLVSRAASAVVPVAPSSPASIAVRPETAATATPVPPRAVAKREVAELVAPPAPAPAPKPSELRAVPPTLEQVTTTGVVASRATEGIVAADSARSPRDNVSAQRTFAGAAAPAAGQRMMQAFDASGGSPEGCYRLLSDSARTIALPERFALQRDSAGRNVVLRLSVENRPDSVLPGFAWRQLSPTVARLTAPTTQLVLTTSGGGRGRLETASGSADVPLQRTSCRP